MGMMQTILGHQLPPSTRSVASTRSGRHCGLAVARSVLWQQRCREVGCAWLHDPSSLNERYVQNSAEELCKVTSSCLIDRPPLNSLTRPIPPL